MYPQPVPGLVYPRPVPVCRWCGLPSAADVSFRTMTAAIFFMSLRSMPGPYCRVCGIATFRATTTRTLALGWWGFPAFLINMIFIGMNINARRIVNRLPSVKAPPPGPQLPVGKPLRRRPLAYIAVVPIAWLLFGITGMTIHILNT